MRKITIGILVVLATLCLCSCATNSAANVKYPRIYTITSASREAVLENAVKKIPAESVAAVGGVEEIQKAVRSQIPEGFLTITLINEKRCTMMVTVNSSSSVLEGRIEDGVLKFEIGDTKDYYYPSKNMKTIKGNWYGVDVVLNYDET